MKELQFTITIEEANLLLNGLGHLPFAQVNQLISKLQNQAKPQLPPEPEPPRIENLIK